MRAAGSTAVQQSLTPEASAMVKQAVSLARHRGHAQVTPLHVATTMLSIPTGLLRSACLQSHSQSHPLRCKALDLCFSVALHRLPSSSQILMGPYRAHHQSPSLSNALVAAFKRAQAHQRRGSAVDAQQQPVLAVRIDVEQLIISILDDPSVSRVMKEAGFSSTQVKANVEKAISLGMVAPPNPNPNPNPNPSKPKHGGSSLGNEEVMTVVETLIGRKKRSIVMLGECLASSEGVVRRFVDATKKGEMPADLKSLQFVPLSLLSFEKMSREEVEKKVDELRCLVRSCRVVLYLGDLKWVADYWLNCQETRGSLYLSIAIVVKEIGKLVHNSGDDFWLMAIATQQTYLRCRVGNPSLETIWCLQPLTFPAVSLDLSLNYDSNLYSQLRTNRSNEDGRRWHLLEDGIRNELSSSPVGSPNITNSNHWAAVLPPWLLQHREESRTTTISDLVSLRVKAQCKWNSILNSDYHQQNHSLEKTLDFSSVSPSSSSLFDSQQTHQASSHNPNSTSSTDTIEVEYLPKFMELNAENLKTLCNSLEKVSCHKEIIPKIASAILQCRSGMMRRKERLRLAGSKVETWLFFLGNDTEGKEKIARGLSALVFGSHTDFVSVGLSEFSSSSDLGIKRSRSEASHSYLERVAGAIKDNPHRVFLLEDIDNLDYYSQMDISNAIRSGTITCSTGENVSVGDAIIILSCEIFDSRSRSCSPPVKQKLNMDEEKEGTCEEEITASASFDLNLIAESGELDWSVDDVRILEAVDSTFIFKCPDEL